MPDDHRKLACRRHGRDVLAPQSRDLAVEGTQLQAASTSRPRARPLPCFVCARDRGALASPPDARVRPDIAHQLLRLREALEVPNGCWHARGNGDVHAKHGHQPLDARLYCPVWPTRESARVAAPLNSLAAMVKPHCVVPVSVAVMTVGAHCRCYRAQMGHSPLKSIRPLADQI